MDTVGKLRSLTKGIASRLPRQAGSSNGAASKTGPASGPPAQAGSNAGLNTEPNAGLHAQPNAWSAVALSPEARPSAVRLEDPPPATTGALGRIRGGIDGAGDASSPNEPERPAVRLRRLAGVASWALVLVLAGVATAIVGLFRVFGESPAWFTPAFITCGVIGMLLAMMAFASLRFRGVPWMFMAASTITLLAAFVMLRVAA